MSCRLQLNYFLAAAFLITSCKLVYSQPPITVDRLEVAITDGASVPEGTSSHTFTFSADIFLSFTSDAATAQGVSLWALAIQVIGDGSQTCTNVIPVTLTPAQSGVPATFQTPGSITNVVASNVDLSGCLCSNVTRLQVTLTSTTFSLGSTPITATANLTCQGLIGRTLTIVRNNAVLVENGNNQVFSLDIIGNSESQSRSIMGGSNYWGVTVYLATGTLTSNTPVAGTMTRATVPGVDSTWIAGASLTLSNINVTLNILGNGSCSFIQLLCTSLSRNDLSTLMFTIEGNEIVSCAPISCVGVLIKQVIPAYTTQYNIIQGERNDGLVLSVAVERDLSRATIAGTNLWQASVFGNAASDCMASPQVPGTVVIPSATGNFGLSGAARSILPEVTVSLNMQNAACSQAAYICFDLMKGSTPSPDYSLSFNPTAARYGSVEVTCLGLTVATGMVTTSSQFAAYKANHQVEFTATFTSTANSGSISGTGLWNVVVFPAANSDGSGATGMEISVDLGPTQLTTSFLGNGRSLPFNNLVAMLDLNSAPCGTYRHLCVRLESGSLSNPNFMLNSDPFCSAMITCQNVLLTNTVVTIPGGLAPNGFPLYEGVASQDIYLDVVVSSDPTGGGVPSGTDHWQVNVTTPVGYQLSSLTQTQKDLLLTAGVDLTFARVQTTLDLTNARCSDLTQVCAEVMRSPASTLNFALGSDSQENTGCLTVPCQGIEVTSLIIGDVSNFVLTEGSQDHRLTFPVTVNSRGNAGSVRGTGQLWDMLIYLSPNATFRDLTISRTADNGVWQTVDIIAGVQATLPDVQVSLNLDSTCANMRFLCVELMRATGETFVLDPSLNILKTCRAVSQCNGVDVSSVGIVITGGGPVVEGAQVNDPLIVQVNLTFSPSSANVSGADFWNVTIFGSSTEFGVDMIDPLTAQTNGDPLAGVTVPLGEINWIVDMASRLCIQVPYICVEVRQTGDAPFSTSFEAKRKCIPLDCEGVVIVFEDFTLQQSEITQARSQEMLVANTITAITGGNGASIADDATRTIWNVFLFLSSTSDGSTSPFPANTPTMFPPATFSSADAGMGIGDNDPLSFTSLSFVFSTESLLCGRALYVCLELTKGADINETITFPANSTCKPIDCRGVQFTTASLTVPPNTVLRENVANNLVTVSFDATTSSQTAVLQSGVRLWWLQVFVSTQSDGNSTVRSGKTLAELDNQANDQLEADGVLALSNVRATMNLEGFICPSSQVYLCAELQRNPTSFPLFDIQGSPSPLVACEPADCQGVLISSIVLSGVPPTINERTAVMLTLDVDASIGGADATGTNLWRIKASLRQNDMVIASVDNIPLGEQANQDVEAGSNVTFSDLPVTLDLANFICPYNGTLMLCVELSRGQNSDANFTVSGATLQCEEVMCIGVHVVDSMVASSSGELLEGNADNPVTLDLVFTSGPNSSDVAGTGLWSVAVFANNMPDGTGTRVSEVAGNLGVNSESFPLMKGGTVEFIGVSATLNLNISTYAVCEDTRWVCAELRKGPSRSVNFTLTDSRNALIACQSFDCRGVQIAGTNFLTNQLTITEDSGNFDVDFLSIGLLGGPNTASLPHVDGNFKFEVFINTIDGTSGNPPERTPFTPQTTSSTLGPGSEATFRGTVTLDLTNVFCADAKYLCIMASRGDNSTFRFSLEGVPNTASLVHCQELDCIGVRVMRGEFNTMTTRVVTGEPSQNISLDASFNTSSTGASIRPGSNLFILEAFLSASSDGQGEVTAGQSVTLRGGSESQPVTAGGAIQFDGAFINLDTTMWTCFTDNFLCIRLGKAPDSSLDYTLVGWDGAGPDGAQLLNCRPITCQGVVITRVSILTDFGALNFQERDASTTISVDIGFDFDRNAGSVNGTNLWTVMFALNDAPNGLGNRFGTLTTASLSPENANMAVISEDRRTRLRDVSFALPAVASILCQNATQFYLCVKVEKSPQSVPDFTLEIGGWRCQSIECFPVVISAIDFEVSSPLYLLENTMNFLRVNLNITTSDLSANISGTGLWASPQFEVRDVQTSRELPAVPNYWTEDRQNTGLVAGQVNRFDNIFPVEINSAGVMCNSLDRFCLTFSRGSSPLPLFGVSFLPPLPTACIDINCRGVEIVSTVITNVGEGAFVIERSDDHMIELSTLSTSAGDAASIAGTNLWAMQFYYTASDKASAFSSVQVPLSTDKRNLPLAAGENLVLANLVAGPVNLASLVCPPNGLYLCVKLGPNRLSAPSFTLSGQDGDPSALIDCRSVSCKGVQVTNTTLVITRGALIPVERTNFHRVEFDFTASSDPGGAGVAGTGLWQMRIFANRRQDGSHRPLSYERTVDLLPDQMNAAMVAGQSISFNSRQADLNLQLSNTECRQTPYFCGQLMKGGNPTPEFSLQAIPDNALVNCQPMDCNGVKIETFTLTKTNIDIPLRENANNQRYEFDVSLTSSIGKMNVTGVGLWKFEAYLNNAADCLGDQVVSQTAATIGTGQQDQDLIAGDTINFNVVASLDYMTTCPPWEEVYICLEVFVGDLTSTSFTLFGDIVQGVPIQCRGVEVTNTESTVVQGGNIVESDLEVNFGLNLLVSSDRDGSSAVGSNLWSVVVYTSATEDCQMPSSDRVNATFFGGIVDSPLNAGAMLRLNNIQATVPLPSEVLCENVNFVCTELKRNPLADPSFTLVSLPDEKSLMASSMILCRGLHITSTLLTLGSGEPLLVGERRHPISFDFSFTSDVDSASVSNPQNLFNFQVAATNMTSPAGVRASPHSVTVPFSPMLPFEIVAGRAYDISVEADLNLVGARCRDVPFICVTLMKGDNSEPPYSLTSPSANGQELTSCTDRLECLGVIITNSDLRIESGFPLLEHSAVNQVNLIVGIESDADGGNALGNNLWSVDVRLSNEDPTVDPDAVVYRTMTTGTLLNGDANQDLLAGNSVDLNITANLDLTGLTCQDVQYVVVILTNPDAVPAFTLQYRNRSFVVVSRQFECQGVFFGSLVLAASAGYPLLELAAYSNLTLNVAVNVPLASTTIEGSDLWEVTVFLSTQESGQGTRQAETEALLTPSQGSVPIIAGAVSNLDDVDVTLTTAGLYCTDMQYLCVEVWRGDQAQPYYNIDSPASQSELRSCVPTTCIGVILDAVATTILTAEPLIEQRPNQAVRLEINITTAQESAQISGEDLWKASVFVTTEEDGSGTRRGQQAVVIPPSEISKSLSPGSMLTLRDLMATLDLSGIPCSEMPYICISVEANNPTANPNFNIAGNLVGCTPIECISVAIESGMLALVSNEVLEGDTTAQFTLDASYTPWINSRSLQEDNSWALSLFVTSCEGDVCGSEYLNQPLALTQSQQDQEVVVGTPLVFDVDVTLNLVGLTCEMTSHLCVTLSTQENVAFTLGGFPLDQSLLACAELLCFSTDVDLRATEVSEQIITVEFSEAFGDFDLYVLRYLPRDGSTRSPFPIPRNFQRLLDFNQLVPGRLYTISLTLVDNAVEKSVPVVIQQRTLPDPVELQLESVTSSELTVFWDEAEGDYNYYVVMLDPPDNSLPITPREVYPIEGRRITFTGLLMARSYNVSIVTVSAGIRSRSSSVVANTEPSTPDVTVTDRRETSISLQFFIDQSYIIDQYEITYVPVGTMPQPIVLPPEIGTTLTNLVPGQLYNIELVAVTYIAGNVTVRSTPATTAVRTLPMAPADITHVPTETTIIVQWPRSEGELDYYTVTFTPSFRPDTIVLKNAPREIMYSSLGVASEYTVTITTHIDNPNENLVSSPITRVFFTLPNPPGAITIVDVTTTSIEFQWQDAEGPRDGYLVTFDPSEPEFVPQSPFLTGPNVMLLAGIQPHVTVDFMIKTTFSNVVSRPQILRQRTFPALPGQVRDFEITSVDSDNIGISFRSPESPNGLILAYLVSLTGVKSGEPTQSAFQTITALPNDVQFNEFISSLTAGYTYTLSIQATNTEGSGEPVTLDPVTLPIREPLYTGVPDEQFVLDVKTSTVTVRLRKGLFSDRNGVVQSYTILVHEVGANDTAPATLPSYQQVRNLPIIPVYQALPVFNPFTAENAVRRRREAAPSSNIERRQAVESLESVDIVVGEQDPCPSLGYCNGALNPITSYRFRVRAFTDNNLYTDTPWSEVVTTRFNQLWFFYALIPFLIIILIIVFIMCLCTCISGDRKKPVGKQSGRMPRKVKETSLNENTNNSSTRLIQEAPQAPPPVKKGPTSRPVALVMFGQHVQKMTDKSGDNFSKEYEELNMIGESHSKETGSLSGNMDKNRYGNILPFDYNRIKLNKDDDYINASLMSGLNGEGEYIATQGPLANTVNDFWQMIWENNVPSIACVGSCVEKALVKFVQYWPSDSVPLTFGDITVSLVSERKNSEHGHIIRDLCLESGSETRTLRQVQLTSWPLHGVPKNSDKMLHFIRTVRLQLPQDTGPLVVHCGAGIGRTGVFIVLDILTQVLAKDEQYIDIFGTVVTKREERTNMVQTLHQYEFLHKAVLDILNGSVAGANWMLKSKRLSVDSDQPTTSSTSADTM